MSSNKPDDRNDRGDDRRDGYDDDRHDEHDHALVLAGTNGNDTLTGTSGNDTIVGRDGNDIIYGLGGNDKIDGGKGNDTLIGGAGNDILDGGAGLDVAVYSGNFSDYKLTLSRDGGHSGEGDDDHSAMTVHDLRNGSPDGTDVLKNIEVLRFNDGEYRDGHFISNNHPATITGVASGSVAEAGGVANSIPGIPAASGALTVTDPDPGQNVFQTPAGLVGTYGNFSFNAATGAWNYTLDTAKSDVLAQGQVAHDTLMVKSLDGTASQVIDVTVTGANDAPVVTAQSLSALEGGTAVTVGALATASDADSGTTLTVVNLPATLPAGVSYNATTHGFTLNPADAAYNSLAQGVHQSVTVNYAVSDGITSTPTSVTFDITGTNDAPVVTAQIASATEGGAAVTVNALATASDVDSGTTLTVVAPPTLPAGVSYNASTHSFTLDPSNAAYNSLAQGVHQSVTVSYAVSDGITSTPTSVTFDITGTNDAPVAPSQTVTAIEGGAIVTANALAGASDADSGTTLTVVGLPATLPAGVSYNSTTHAFALDPSNAAFNSLAQGVHQSVTVSYAVSDGITRTPTSVTFDITGTNDAPVATAQTASATEGGAAVTVNALATASDVDSGTTLTVVAPATLPAGVSYNASTHSFTLDPSNAAYNGLAQGVHQSVTVNYAVSDGIASTPTKVTFDITGTNDAPVAPPQTIAATEGGAIVTANALAGATDPDGGTTLAVVGLPATLPAGVSYNTGTHVFTFNPTTAAYNPLAQGEHESVILNYSVSDGITSTPTSVTIDVTGTNDAPILTAPALVDFDTTLPDAGRIVPGQLSAYDPDHGATQTYGISGGIASHVLAGFDLQSTGTYGTLYLNSANGNYDFVYNAAVDALNTGVNGVDNFTVTVADGLGGTDSKPLTVNLTGTNDATVISGVMPFNYTVGDLAKVVAPSLTLSDPDSNHVTSATVSINSGFTASDVLDFNHALMPANVTASYDSNTGVLVFTTVSGSSTLADYATLLDSVTFAATATGTGGRTIAFTVADGNVVSQTVDTSNLNLLDLSTSVLHLPGVSAGDAAGFSVSAAGDVNHDGYADVIVGAPWVNSLDPLNLATGIGSGYVVYGKASGFGGELPLANLASDNTQGFSVSGNNTFDNVGFSVRNAGDVNGDGFSDVVIGSPYSYQANGDKSGVTYVVFGHAANSNMSGLSLDGSAGFKVIGGAGGNYAGYSVGGAGDVNGDGFADVIIGAPRADFGHGTDSGAAFVLFGHVGPFTPTLDLGSSPANSPLDGANGFSIVGLTAQDWTGASVAAAGDVNGDGISDMIIGTATPNATPASATGYVVFGHASGFGASVDLSALDGSNGFRVYGAGTSAPLSGFGKSHYAVRSAGDVNGDGFGDVIIGAPYAVTSHGETGAAYVVFGHAGSFGTVDPVTHVASVDLAHLAPTQGFEVIGVAAGDRAGYAVSAAGDVNGDGYGDLIIGAPSAQQNGSPAGTSYVIFGKASGFGTYNTSTHIDTIDLGNLGNDGFRISAAAPHNDSGYAVSAAGDVNGDGFADLLVASSNASPHSLYGAGESYVIFGAKFITTPNTQVGSDAPGHTTVFAPGTTADDIFVAGQGNATMIGGGGNDSFSGGIGDDTMHIGAVNSPDASFLKIDGGGGFNTLVLDGSNATLDLTVSGVDGKIHNIDRIDLGASGNNTLALNIHDVLNMSENSNQLFVTGHVGDSVTSIGQGWTLAATGIVDHGVTYDSYTHGLANLLIDEQLLAANSVHLS